MMATKAELLKAIKRLRNAETEMRRAMSAADPERQNRAGTVYAIAKIRLFGLADLIGTK